MIRTYPRLIPSTLNLLTASAPELCLFSFLIEGGFVFRSNVGIKTVIEVLNSGEK